MSTEVKQQFGNVTISGVYFTEAETNKMREGLRRQIELQDAEQMAGRWLYLGNLAKERGDFDLAERHYARGQKWHDKMNRLLGHGDGTNKK